MPSVICSRPEFNELHKRSHNSSLVVVDVRRFEYHIACYLSVTFSIRRCNEKSSGSYMWLVYSAEIILFFILFPEHIDAFLTSWHNFRNSFAVKIRC